LHGSLVQFGGANFFHLPIVSRLENLMQSLYGYFF